MSKYSENQNNPLDVSNLQCFIIPVWVKKHNMKDKNCYVVKIFITYKSQAF